MVCCKSCYSLKIPGTWLEFDDLDSSVSYFVEDSISWNDDAKKIKSELSLRQLDPQKYRVKVVCEGNFHDLALTSNLETEIPIKFQVCQNCSRQAGGYYEAILQVRTKRKDILDMAVDMVYNELDSSSSDFFTTEAGAVRGGYDFQLSSTEKARSVSRDLMIKFGGHVNETNTLVGRKDGRDLLRHTFGVRLPNVKNGDYLFTENEVSKVIGVNRRRAKLIQISPPFRQQTVEVDGLRNLPILDDPLDVQIVSGQGSEFLLLDPFTLQTVEAVSPKDWDGESVKALRYGNETFFVWE